ncbi:hypothetical protein D3C87_1898310 [compost metagenome]
MAKALPRSGFLPVQLAPAVSKKPTAMVATKPHSISCACQNTPPNTPVMRAGACTHSQTDASAQKQPARYSGRKPISVKARHCGRGRRGGGVDGSMAGSGGMALLIALRRL